MRTHLDLCSGIAGFALAAGWNGYTTIGFCEIDPFCQRVISAHYPGVPIHDDLKTLTAETVRGWIGRAGDSIVADSSSQREREKPGSVRQPGVLHDQHRKPIRTRTDASSRSELDLLTAGYPCQPFSHAGKRLGAEDDRHLWPFIARLVDDLRPRWCVFENVAGHISMGLDDVLSDMEALDYACGATVIPAAAVGAPHRRDRIWIVAHAGSERRQQVPRSAHGDEATDEGRTSELHHQSQRDGQGIGSRTLADSQGEHGSRKPIGDGASHPEPGRADQSRNGRQTLCSVGQSDDGIPGQLAQHRFLDERWNGDPLNAFGPDWEDGVPRVVDVEPQRVAKLKALGNAVVPQVAYVVIASIVESEVAA